MDGGKIGLPGDENYLQSRRENDGFQERVLSICLLGLLFPFLPFSLFLFFLNIHTGANCTNVG
jgi:hypothetical protein